MSLPTGRRKGSCSLWLKRNWVLMSLVGLALASAALSVLLYLEPCDKKTQYDTHNTTTVVNVTSYENRTVLENVRLRRRNLNAARRRRRAKQHPTQVTIRETIIELENVTTRENVSVVVNETVLYNATYMSPRRRVIVDAPAFYSLNVGTTSRTTSCATSRTTSRSTRRTTHFAASNGSRSLRDGAEVDEPHRRVAPAQVTYNPTINVTEFVNVTKEVTTSYNITSRPVWKSTFYGTF